jgi:hypothetical protein
MLGVGEQFNRWRRKDALGISIGTPVPKSASLHEIRKENRLKKFMFYLL